MELKIDYKGKSGALKERFTLNVNDRRFLPFVDLPDTLQIGKTLEISHIQFSLHEVRHSLECY